MEATVHLQSSNAARALAFSEKMTSLRGFEGILAAGDDTLRCVEAVKASLATKIVGLRAVLRAAGELQA